MPCFQSPRKTVRGPCVGPRKPAGSHHTSLLLLPCHLRRFLEADLTSVDRSKTPWVVVGMHRGMYVDDPTDAGPGSPSATLRQQVERLLVEKSVDLVLNGHARLFHHSCPIVQGHCVGYSADGSAMGPVHAMLGIGGAAIPLRAQQAAPAWVVDEAFDHGVAQLVADKTSLKLQVRGVDE